VVPPLPLASGVNAVGATVLLSAGDNIERFSVNTGNADDAEAKNALPPGTIKQPAPLHTSMAPCVTCPYKVELRSSAYSVPRIPMVATVVERRYAARFCFPINPLIVRKPPFNKREEDVITRRAIVRVVVFVDAKLSLRLQRKITAIGKANLRSAVLGHDGLAGLDRLAFFRWSSVILAIDDACSATDELDVGCGLCVCGESVQQSHDTHCA